MKQLYTLYATILLSLLGLGNKNTVNAQTALQFDGTNDYVTFGQATSTLGTSVFTLECWFKRTGTGIATSTGAGGVNAIPLISKGMAQADGSTSDMNYFLGIRYADNVLVADYEEGAGQTSPGLNHPIAGTTVIQTNIWYHVAATFDGTTWRIYLNGNPEATLLVGATRLPQSGSIQWAAIATALGTGGTIPSGQTQGAFSGVIDEVRIWNVARSQADIQASMHSELTSGTGLLGRWGLNDGLGTTALNSVAGSPSGTLTNGPLWTEDTPFNQENDALRFGSGTSYVTFGDNASLKLAQFTIETWFRRDGAGTTTNTGTGGMNAIPLVTKGRGEAEGSNVDMNYFLGIRGTDNVIAADFEDMATGLNHPVYGTTPIVNGTWYHAAATFNGTSWAIYLNGKLEGTQNTSPNVPRSDCIQHAGLGTAMNSTGVAEGHFNGTLDETRIWNYARTQPEINATINNQLEGTHTGLVARWPLNEGSGTVIHSTAGSTIDGTITNPAGSYWTGTAPFNIIVDVPNIPTSLSASAVSFGQVSLSWTDNSDNELNFYIERSTDGGSSYLPLTTLGANATNYNDFNLSPSTQYYYRVYASNAYGNSGYTDPVSSATTPASGDYALQFNGTNQYVTFGQATSTLGVTSFTLEAWVQRAAGGTTMETGTGGFGRDGRPTIYPVITKGMGQDEAAANNMNYFLGITSTGVIGADFEATVDGDNNPVWGTTTIPVDGHWHHIVATYNGSAWMLYLDGTPETIDAAAVQTPNRTPEILSTQHAALASSLQTSGLPTSASGYFSGVIDEARIWNRALSQSEIQAGMLTEVITGTGLLGRWGLNEGTGGYANNSIASSAYGELKNSPGWVSPGSPFAISSTGTASFQNGLNGYSGTLDTYLEASNPTSNNGGLGHIHWDGSPQEWALIRFDDIFGTGPGQIPEGSSIISATLSYHIDDVGNEANVNEVIAAWDENTTYSTFGATAGVQAEDYGSLIGTTTGSSSTGTKTLDVTSSLVSWSATPSANRGWLFSYTGNSGVQARSSEYTTVSQRPLLQISYITNISSAPAAPSGLTATASAGSQILLAWSDNSNIESGFRIERSATGDGGPFTLLETVGPNVRSYTDGALLPNTDYCYRVYAFNSIGDSDASNTVCTSTAANPNNAVDFGGTNAYVQIDNNAALQLSQFTIETWFRRDGVGVITASGTGTGGISSPIPLVTKGTSEAEETYRDINYFLCINSATNTIAFDFEEGPGGPGPLGQNHPLSGTTAIVNGTWYHAAVTYDGTTMSIYLNGNLEASQSFGVPVASGNTGRLALGSSLTSTGTAKGFFDGVMDEVRIWSTVRTQSDIRSTINSQISSSETGLMARWGLDEGAGTTVASTAGITLNGTITGTNYQWVGGAPFNINFSPGQPVLVSPEDESEGLVNSPSLQVSVADPDSESLTVSFYGRQAAATAPGEDFSIIVLPDAQYYTREANGGLLAMFTSQTNWCMAQQDNLNIAYAAMVGDITDLNVQLEWERGVTAMSILEDELPGLPDGIPYGIAAGNHDGAPNNMALYNTYFGVSRFEDRSYYGGNYGSDNNHNYVLFRAGSMDFIVINLGIGTNDPVLADFDGVMSWANGLLSTYRDRRAIVVNHYLLTGDNWGGPGQAIYNALRGNQNLFLMLCGHLDTEGLRTDVYNNNTIYTIRSDYQGTGSGGNGWLRILKFSPVNNTITVSSYSPYLNQWNYAGRLPFDLQYAMTASNSFEHLGTVTGISSGSVAGLTWPGLSYGTDYEWYATVSDGNSTVTGPVWSFTTDGTSWTGTTSRDWGTASNWSGGAVPTYETDVSIPLIAGGNQPVISAVTEADCRNLVIAQGASLTIDSRPAIDSNPASSGSLIVNGTSSGIITYNRYINTTDYHYYSSPVASNTATNTDKVDGVWRWDEPAGDWTIVANTSACVSGVGYTSRTAGDGILTFTGPVAAAASVTATSPYYSDYSSGSREEYDSRWTSGRTAFGGGGWNLLGNPFTSALRIGGAEGFLDANDGDGSYATNKFDPNYVAVYIYDGSSYHYRGMDTGFEDPVTGETPANQVFGFNNVQAGQGFFVLAMKNDVTFTYNRSMQIHAGLTPMLKSSRTSGHWSGLQLKVKYGTGESMTTVVYNEDMTTGLDPGYDVGQLSTGPDVEIYTSLVEKDNSVNFSRQALPVTDLSTNIVPVGIDTELGGEVIFSAFTIPLGNNKFWLEDRTTGIFTDLTLKSYTVTLPAKTYGTGRFFIYTSVNTPTDIKEQASNAGTRIWTSQDKLIIKGDVSPGSAVAVYDLQGNMILHTLLPDEALNTVAMPSGSHGVFLVKVIDGVKVHTQKVVIL